MGGCGCGEVCVGVGGGVEGGRGVGGRGVCGWVSVGVGGGGCG